MKLLGSVRTPEHDVATQRYQASQPCSSNTNVVRSRVVKSGAQVTSWYHGVAAVEDVPHTLLADAISAWRTRLPVNDENDEVGASRIEESIRRTRWT